MSSTDKKGEEWVVVEEEVDDQNDAITEEEEEFDGELMRSFFDVIGTFLLHKKSLIVYL